MEMFYLLFKTLFFQKIILKNNIQEVDSEEHIRSYLKKLEFTQ